MLDCRCYGQHSHKNKSRTEIRREPFVRRAFVLDKTCLINGAVRIILYFPCINGPNVTDKLDYMSVASGQRLVLAVVNSSYYDADDHMQSCNGLDKEIRKMKKLYNSAPGIQKDISAELTQ